MGRLLGPEFSLLPTRALPRIPAKEQATTGLTQTGQNQANASQSPIFQINGSARSHRNPHPQNRRARLPLHDPASGLPEQLPKLGKERGSVGAQMHRRVGKGGGVSEMPKMGLERARGREGKGRGGRP